MTENVRVYNPNAFEVVIDLEGHSLDGHTATDVSRDTLTDHLIDTGQLLIQHPAPEALPAAPLPVVEEQPPGDPEATPVVEAPKPKQRRTTTGNGSEK
ncbi:hypothetical protein HYQ19_gp017 [Arthrobacter phage DrYang]|uniref:Uncharacterized protein n=1 Tax=Arthrobacter phage DrYang TaxID=2686080 RepID=A0A6B9JD12_9CAUD|nr:hypothetical protein HYQ19_gp017 [Arthrobacter phage DrYang]QGZ17116.1 hypothetical protein SEA_DRYANG_17 [Arthrobacter phage DrYang]